MAGEVKYDKNKIIAGDVVFGLEGFSLKNRWNWFWNKEELSEKYERMAMQLMNRHYEFYEQFQDREIEEYVTNGAFVRCSNSEMDLCTGLCNVIEHGVITSNGQAVLTCKDCTTSEGFNGDFGKCKVDHSTYKIPGMEESAWVGNPHSCFPILEKEWRLRNSDLAIAVDVKGEDFVDALRSSAYLVCMYGGEITVIDIPDKPEEEEKEDEFELIDGWLRLYKEQTIPGEGRFVPKHEDADVYDWAMEGELSEKHSEENWFRNTSPVSQDIRGKGEEFTVKKTSNNLYVDGEGRYWVAVGPNVVNPNHSLEYVKHDIDPSEVFYGTKMDVLVEGQYTGERYYVRVVIGETKEHSAPHGLFQTGKPFNTRRPEKPESAGNTVEFMGYHIVQIPTGEESSRSSVNITNNYRLIGIYVYDGDFNYE